MSRRPAEGELSQKYIKEHDAVREVLLGLQGLQNTMLVWVTAGTNPMTFAVRRDLLLWAGMRI